MDRPELFRKPNSPEYVEVTKVDIHDMNDAIEFSFTFAKPVGEITMTELWDDPNTAIPKTIRDTLRKKGWLKADGNLDRSVLYVPPRAEGAQWTFLYKKRS